MSSPAEDSTDDSSIRPVSSLRSLFENKLSANQSPVNPVSRQPSPFLDKPGADEQRHRLGGRISLDLPRPNDPRRSPPRTADFSRPGPQVPGAATPQALHPGNSKPRPISMGPLSPPRSPPLVTVDSPRSPPMTSDMDIQAPTPSRGIRIESLNSGSRNGSPTGLRHFRIPSRASTPAIETRPAPSLAATPVSSASGDPKKPLGSEMTGQAKRLGHGIPPPINRAGKPKMISTKPATEKSSGMLDAASDVQDDRVSPFNTPPSSDNTPLNEDASPPPFEQKRPKVPPPRSSGPRDSYFTARNPQRPDAEQRDAASPQNYTKTTPPKLPRSESNQSNGFSDDSPENRPGLPPRREKADVRSERIKVPPEPPVRRSMDTSARPFMDTLSHPAALVAETNTKFMPPPRRTPTGNLAQGSSVGGTRPSLDVNRAPAITPRASMDVGRPSVTLSRPSVEAGRTGVIQSRVSVDTNRIGSIPATTVSRRFQDDSDDAAEPLDRDAPTLSDFPDSSQANRRPPMLRQGPREIATKYDTKLFAVCGEYICTTGYVTRVWDVLTGELLMSLSHGDTIKVTAISFRPSKDVEDEGKRIWLGTNIGEIMEIDVPSQSVVSTKGNAHPRREIIKIYRCADEMWSLDDDGRLHIWTPDETGSPSLGSLPLSFRVPKGHTCSIITGRNLWIATGKDIRIFQRTSGTHCFAQLTQQPLSHPSTGDVTAAAMIPSQPDLVYFGHADGKVTIYHRKDYSLKGIVSVSLYKISCLVGVGDFLWAGYNTGMIYVYDTRATPWKVKKDWRAHENMIAGIIVDRTSIWKLDRLQVASLGSSDKTIRLWDGMLREDWLDEEMQEHDTDFCDFREVSALVMTWNAGASKPTSLRQDERGATFFRDLLTAAEPPDILVFGFQELVDLEDKKVTAKSFFKSKKKKDTDASEQEHMSHQYRAWRDHLIRAIDEYLPASHPYTLLHSSNLVGLFTCVFVKSSERMKIRDVGAAEVKLGMGGMHGNKGALIVRFILDDSSLCFINCHLAAGQSQTQHRNNDVANIMEASCLPYQRDATMRSDIFVGGGDGSMILDHEICILNGDLNYRIDAMPRDTVINAVRANNLSKLLERDQLLLSRKRNPGFRLRAFREQPITFAPTYKYDVGTDKYDTSEKKRSPAWCDRLLYRGLGRIKQTEYRRHEVRVSDHRPVTGRFRIRVKTISPKRRSVVREESEQRFEEMKHRIATDIKLDYLVNVFNMPTKEAQQALARR